MQRQGATTKQKLAKALSAYSDLMSTNTCFVIKTNIILGTPFNDVDREGDRRITGDCYLCAPFSHSVNHRTMKQHLNNDLPHNFSLIASALLQAA